MGKLLSSVSCNLDTQILSACVPLFSEAKVEAVEWSFDALYTINNIPAWFEDLMMAFGKEGRLIGHGVFFSLFSGRWSSEQSMWLNHLSATCRRYKFDHVTEHFGFMTGSDFHKGAPLSIPFNQTTLAIGTDRLKRISAACERPVGLENLAFSYSLEDVKRHGAFLQKLVEPVNGFIILDLHNLYCQMHNFEIDYERLIELYPLDKIREIHISGGSWDDSVSEPGKIIRRDTHDSSVPQEVFHLLKQTLTVCPNLKFVVLEQLSNGLNSEESKKVFYRDFVQMDETVAKINDERKAGELHSFMPSRISVANSAVEDENLHRQQRELSWILENASSCEQVFRLLAQSSLSHSEWNIEEWQPSMIETAFKIARKWKDGGQV